MAARSRLGRPLTRPSHPVRPESLSLLYNENMPLTIEEVEHIAQLARLELDPEHISRYREQLSHILDYIAKLRELDTSDVPPTAGGGLDRMTLRPDRSRPGLRTEALLRNAPDAENDQFKIPPVFE